MARLRRVVLTPVFQQVDLELRLNWVVVALVVVVRLVSRLLQHLLLRFGVVHSVGGLVFLHEVVGVDQGCWVLLGGVELTHSHRLLSVRGGF